MNSSLGSHKCTELGYTYELDEVSSPEDKTVNEWIATISAATKKSVIKA